jgi:NAD(P)H-dependent FMN reductase
MYHGTFSAPLKNALDHCGPDEFGGKAVGLVSVAGGSFPRQALGHLRTVCRALDAWTFPLQVAVPNSSDAFVDDVIVEAALTARLQQLGTAVVEYAGVDQYPALAAADAQGDDAQVVGHSQD